MTSLVNPVNRFLSRTTTAKLVSTQRPVIQNNRPLKDVYISGEHSVHSGQSGLVGNKPSFRLSNLKFGAPDDGLEGKSGVEWVEAWEQKYGDIHTLDRKGDWYAASALFRAVENIDLEAVKKLIELGANTKVEAFGFNPLTGKKTALQRALEMSGQALHPDSLTHHHLENNQAIANFLIQEESDQSVLQEALKTSEISYSSYFDLPRKLKIKDRLDEISSQSPRQRSVSPKPQ